MEIFEWLFDRNGRYKKLRLNLNLHKIFHLKIYIQSKMDRIEIFSYRACYRTQKASHWIPFEMNMWVFLNCYCLPHVMSPRIIVDQTKTSLFVLLKMRLLLFISARFRLFNLIFSLLSFFCINSYFLRKRHSRQSQF